MNAGAAVIAGCRGQQHPPFRASLQSLLEMGFRFGGDGFLTGADVDDGGVALQREAAGIEIDGLDVHLPDGRSLVAADRVIIAPDASVLMFTVAAAALTGILFGLAPAFRGTHVDVAPTLKENSGNMSRLTRASV